MKLSSTFVITQNLSWHAPPLWHIKRCFNLFFQIEDTILITLSTPKWSFMFKKLVSYTSKLLKKLTEPLQRGINKYWKQTSNSQTRSLQFSNNRSASLSCEWCDGAGAGFNFQGRPWPSHRSWSTTKFTWKQAWK